MNNAEAINYFRYGFDVSAHGSQQTFRAIFAAMEHPGQLVTICENPLAPEKSTTIIVQVDDILPGTANKYSGIFVDKAGQLELKGVPDRFWKQWQHLSSLHPLGINIFFTCDDVLIALP